MPWMWLVPIAMAICACTPETPPPSPSPAPAAPVPQPLQAIDAGISAPRVDIPPLRLDAAPADAAKQARKLNTAGYALYRKRKLAESIENFRAALAADPAHLLARYNLACALHLSGDTARGLALLDELDRGGCAKCRGLLAHAATDPDWRDQWTTPAFVTATSAGVEQGKRLRAAAGEIAKTWIACKAAGLAKFIDPAHSIKLEEGHCCYDKPGEGQRTITVAGAGAASKLVPEKLCASADRRTTVSDRIVCDGKCCSYEGDVHDGDWVTLLGVCFRDDQLVLESFSTGWGP